MMSSGDNNLTSSSEFQSIRMYIFGNEMEQGKRFSFLSNIILALYTYIQYPSKIVNFNIIKKKRKKNV